VGTNKNIERARFSLMRWVDDLSIFRKGLVLMLIPVLFQLFSVVMFWWLYDQITLNRARTAHSRSVVEAVDAVRASMNAGYYSSILAVLVKDWEIEKTETQSLNEVRASVLRLEELTGDNPPQNERTHIIERRFDDFLAVMRELQKVASQPNDATVQSPNPDSANKAKSVISLFHDSFDAKRKLDEEVSGFRSVEVYLQNQRIASLTRILQLAGWFVLGGFIIILCVSSLFFVLFQDAIARRLEIMSNNLKKIGSGEALSPALSGQDEIAQIDAAVHSLAAALAEKALDTEVFLYSVSHDLRSPLVNLSGFTDELRFSAKQLRAELEAMRPNGQNIDPALTIIDKDFEKSFGFIRIAISRLSRIIEALLRLSRAGRVKYKDELTELTPIVQRVAQSLNKSIEEKRADVRIGELPTVYGDEAAYEQIFANLLTNALMYLEPGRPGVIEIVKGEVSSEREKTIVIVRDNGVGMSEGSKKKLFLAFQRFRPDAGPGEGIGLAITRRVVSAMGGSIWCESTEGTGTTFFLALPTEGGSRISMPEAMVGI